MLYTYCFLVKSVHSFSFLHVYCNMFGEIKMFIQNIKMWGKGFETQYSRPQKHNVTQYGTVDKNMTMV